MRLLRIHIALLTGLLPLLLNAQSLHYNRHLPAMQVASDAIYHPASGFHTAFGPYYFWEVDECLDMDSLMMTYQTDAVMPLLTHMKSEKNRLKIDQYPYGILFYPDFTLAGGYDRRGSNSLHDLGIGLRTDAFIGERLYLHSRYQYHSARFPLYMDEYISAREIVPGMGFAYPGGNQYAFHELDIALAWRPIQQITLEGGFGHHFIGDGYRSLLLSDNTANYPYIKIETNIWRVKYVNLWINLKGNQLDPVSEWSALPDKYAAIHYLGWNITERINIGIFESIIWQTRAPGFPDGLEPNYFNPLIFYRPVEFGLGSPDNASLGMTFSWRIFSKQVIYGQAFVDDMIFGYLRSDAKKLLGKDDGQWGYWTNKQAFQAGLRSFDVLWVDGLDVLTELNIARPYTYSHRWPAQNYSHLGRSLAHPLGANFAEWANRLDYSTGRWFASLKLCAAITGLDSAGQGTHYGSDIFQATYDTPEGDNNVVPQFGNKVGQGIKTTILYGGLSLAYLVNPRYNLHLFGKAGLRRLQNDLQSTNDLFLMIGLRTGTDQLVRDF